MMASARVTKVDALFLSPAVIFLVEVKCRPGILTGDAYTWTWRTDGRDYAYDNPLILANRMAEWLKPPLGGIYELVSWIKQWHKEPEPEHGTRMGEYLVGFVDEECRGLGLTREAVVAWQPTATTARRGRRRAS